MNEKPIPGTQIDQIKKGETVDVIGVDGGFYKVNYKGKTGYILDIFINDNELIKIVKELKDKELADQKENKKGKVNSPTLKYYQDELGKYFDEKNEAEKKNRERMLKEREERLSELKKESEKRLIELKKKYGEHIAIRILVHEVWIGMTIIEALDSRGYPDKINKTTYSFGVHEQWVYEGEDSKIKYLYFEDGILKAIQEQE